MVGRQLKILTKPCGGNKTNALYLQIGSYSASQLEQIRSKTQNMSIAGQDSTRSVESTPPQYQYKQQHQRSFSQSSTLSTHQPGSSQPSRSPLSGPMYSFQQGGSMSSLHALENPSQSKRISDSARSIKEGSPLARSTVTGATSGQANGSPSSNGSPSGVRPATLQHQASSSKLSATLSTSSSSASPTMDKNWSPNLNGGQTTQGGMTLFDVISDDPFGGMTFVSLCFKLIDVSVFGQLLLWQVPCVFTGIYLFHALIFRYTLLFANIASPSTLY